MVVILTGSESTSTSNKLLLVVRRYSSLPPNPSLVTTAKQSKPTEWCRFISAYLILLCGTWSNLCCWFERGGKCLVEGAQCGRRRAAESLLRPVTVSGSSHVIGNAPNKGKRLVASHQPCNPIKPLLCYCAPIGWPQI